MIIGVDFVCSLSLVVILALSTSECFKKKVAERADKATGLPTQSLDLQKGAFAVCWS